MIRSLIFMTFLLIAHNVIADCGRLTKDSRYDDLNAILDCIENRIPNSTILNNGAQFIIGNYMDSNGIEYLVSGGGVISDKRTTWSLRTTTKHKVFDVAWTTGPAIGHPQIGSLSIAPKLPKEISYGVLGAESFSGWRQGGLVAVTQAGDSITIWAYHEDKLVFTNVEHATNSLVLTRIKAPTN